MTHAIGVSRFVPGQTDPRDALRFAYSAADEARSSESRVGFYSEKLGREERRRLRLVSDFGAALESCDELTLAYQPRLDLASGCRLGAEALIRWRHPELGQVPPAEFMPLIEQSDLARPATAWVLHQAMAQTARWALAGQKLTISVNVTASNLQETDFVDRVLDCLAHHGLTPASLELELTERALIGDNGRAMSHLQALADAGVTLAIDDFGTGYSSLSYLQTLPCTVVKIDQSFIRDMARDERRHKLVRAIVGLSHDLGYRVVAEGVETREIAELLTDVGCDEAQGYYFGRPVSAAEFRPPRKPRRFASAA